MAVNVNNKISTTELLDIEYRLTKYFADFNKGFFNEFRYGVKFCKEKALIQQELLMYQWVLTYWKQYENGNPKIEENKISLSDFNMMIERIKFLIT